MVEQKDEKKPMEEKGDQNENKNDDGFEELTY